MEVKQDNVLQEAWQSKMDGLPLATPEEALILASIIEKETDLKVRDGLLRAFLLIGLKRACLFRLIQQ